MGELCGNKVAAKSSLHTCHSSESDNPHAKNGEHAQLYAFCFGFQIRSPISVGVALVPIVYCCLVDM